MEEHKWGFRQKEQVDLSNMDGTLKAAESVVDRSVPADLKWAVSGIRWFGASLK